MPKLGIMEISSILVETLNVAAMQGIGFASSLLPHHCSTDSCSEQSCSGRALQISAGMCPTDVVAPPKLRSDSHRVSRKALVQKRRRLRRRRSFCGGPDDDGDGGEEGLFGGDGGGDGPLGGGGGSGGGWNFNNYGGRNWDDSSSSSSGFALDFLYEVISWIAISNCVHFAFKRALQMVTNDIGDGSREKVPS